MATGFESLEELPGAVGTHLGYSDWLTIDQERIDLFAEQRTPTRASIPASNKTQLYDASVGSGCS